MKYAEVRYVGSMQSQTVRGPSGEEYSLSNPMGGSPIPKAVASFEDARYFDEKKGGSFEVEWTAQGELAKKASGPAGSARDMLSNISYHDKLSLISEFDLDPDSRSEDALDEELEEVVQDLQTQMEN